MWFFCILLLHSFSDMNSSFCSIYYKRTSITNNLAHPHLPLPECMVGVPTSLNTMPSRPLSARYFIVLVAGSYGCYYVFVLQSLHPFPFLYTVGVLVLSSLIWFMTLLRLFLSITYSFICYFSVPSIFPLSPSKSISIYCSVSPSPLILTKANCLCSFLFSFLVSSDMFRYSASSLLSFWHFLVSYPCDFLPSPQVKLNCIFILPLK